MTTSSEKIYKGYPFVMMAKITDTESMVSATKLEMRYLKPGATQYATLTATVVNGTIDTIEAKVLAANNNVAGVWTFWPYVENSNGDGMPGTPIQVTIYPEGT